MKSLEMISDAASENPLGRFETTGLDSKYSGQKLFNEYVVVVNGNDDKDNITDDGAR